MSKLAEMMNDQVQMESEAEAYYAVIWGWCQKKGLYGLAKYFKHKSKSEGKDKRWVINFIHYAGLEYDQMPVKAYNKPAGKDDVSTVKGIFSQCVTTELKVGEHLNKIYKEALAEGNALVCKSLKPIMASQFEEITEAKELSEQANRMSTGGDLNEFNGAI